MGFGLFYLAVLKFIPKVKSVFAFKSFFRWTVWRFAFFGCSSLFIPVINVSTGFASSFRGTVWRHIIAKSFSCWTQLILFIQAVFTNINCLRPFNQAAIFLFKQVLNLSPAANKGIAASRAGRCYLRLRSAFSFGLGRTSIIGLLFVIFYFYIFI